MYEDYNSLVNHPFMENGLLNAAQINKDLVKKNGFKVDVEFKRNPTEKEFYCLQLGNAIAHLLTIILQLEHTVLYMSSFTPTKKMKDAGIDRHAQILYIVENYIIRTQTMYDRVLLIIDRLFHIQNKPNRISHESIVTNLHILKTDIPKALKSLKKIIKKYYPDRNSIIHETTFLEDDLRKIEGYSILKTQDNFNQEQKDDIIEILKYKTRDYIKKKRYEFTKTNKKICNSISNLFTVMQPIYENKLSQFSDK